MELNMVSEGMKFLILGMVTVFVFLIILVIALNFQAKIINKYFPQKPARGSSGSYAPKVQTHSPTQGDNKALVAAITAAIQTFKNSKQG